jgi:hypothetical protein
MKKSLSLLMSALLMLASQPLSPEDSTSTSAPTAYQGAIEPYVSYLANAIRVDPVDYVLRLFDKFDIVILCERDHRDISQYELFFQLVSDARFIDKVGHIFTEIGSISNNQRIDSFLKSGETDAQAVERQLLAIYRDLTWSFYWEKCNFYDFLERLHFLNVKLPVSKKLSLFFSDLSFDWQGMTRFKYQNVFTGTLAGRDRLMAQSILSKIEEIDKSRSLRKKYLVIMNYRHAFKNFNGSDNVAEYIYAKYPGRTANVMNSLILLPGSTDKTDNRSPVMDGKWDAAFRYLDNPILGFDFAGSPFGKDRFDYFLFSVHNKTYEDVFNGFIFYLPLEKHELKWNIPGFVDESFLPTLKARIAISSDLAIPENATLTDFQGYFNAVSSMGYPDMTLYDQRIRQWLVY